MTIEVRTAQLSDCRRIAEIHIAAWQAAYANLMDPDYLANLSVSEREKMWITSLSSKGPNNTIVGLVNSNMCGFCSYGPARDTAPSSDASEIIALNIDPSQWSKGVGSELVRYAMSCLKTDNYKSVHLWVLQGNARAIRLYEHIGFKDTGMVKPDHTHSKYPIKEMRFTAVLS